MGRNRVYGNRVTMSLRIDEDLHAEAASIADDERRRGEPQFESLNAFIELAVAEAVARRRRNRGTAPWDWKQT